MLTMLQAVNGWAETWLIRNAIDVPMPDRVSVSHIMDIGLALANYVDKHGSFPPAYSVDKNGKPLLSWRVLILPFLHPQYVRTIDGRTVLLHEAFHYDEPWDSAHNKKLLAYMPEVYWSPLSKTEGWKTNYLGVSGKDMMFTGSKPVKPEDIKDAQSRTIAIIEVNDELAGEWTRPVDFQPDPNQPAKGLGNMPGQQKGWFRTGMVDGHFQRISPPIKPDVLWSLFIINDGKPDEKAGF